VTQPIDSCGVNPVHAQVKRAVNRGDGIVVILFSPGKLPARASEGPGPETHGRDEQIRIPKLVLFHIFFQSFCFHDFLSLHNACQSLNGIVRTIPKRQSTGSCLLRSTAAVQTKQVGGLAGQSP
jgi:hypothetical protein